MTADAGLRALPDFDFDCGCRVEIRLMYAEPSRSHLNNRIFSVAVEILVQSALAGIVINAERLRRAGEALMCVIADRTVRHGGKQNRQIQIELGRQIIDKPSAGIPLDARGLRAEERPRFHRLPQRVDGGIGHLRRTDQDSVPIDRNPARRSHGRQEHAAAPRLTVHVGDRFLLQVRVFPKYMPAFYNLQGSCGTERNAAVTCHTAGIVGCGTEAATGLLNDQVFNTKKGTSFRKSGGEIISAAGDVEGAKQLLADNDIWPEDYDDIYILVRMDEMNDSYQSQQMGYMSKEKAVAQYTKTVWEQLGFHVVVNAVASSTYEELYAAGDYDVIGLDYQMLSVYPIYNLTAFTKEYNGHVKLVTSADRDFDASRGETMYYESVAHVSGYYNAEYDALIASAFAETDAKKRAEILHEAEALLLSDAVVVPLLFNANAYVVSSELSKVSTNYWGAQIFTKTKLKNYVQYLSSVREAAKKEEENQ